ncbi:hypothetical protein LXL04_018955 [Taraxacum kok-saghyz]
MYVCVPNHKDERNKNCGFPTFHPVKLKTLTRPNKELRRPRWLLLFPHRPRNRCPTPPFVSPTYSDFCVSVACAFSTSRHETRKDKAGSQVEVSSDEDGLNGAWFVATVIHPPPSISTTKKNKSLNHHTSNNLVYVEYHNLLSEDGSSRRLREYANVSYVRPSPHPDTNAAAPHFQLNDLVDAFYRDGWWTGVITAVVDSSNFVVTFQNPPDQIQFNSSDLRVHRRWDGGRWVQPEIQRTAGLMFTVGKKVEVCFEGENLGDVWFPATVVENLGNNSFVVEYQQPGIGDEATLQKVTVDYLHIRPSPPHLREKNFVLLEKVDAYYDFGWWSGAITKVVADNMYNVLLKNTKKEREFDCSRVRPHMEWKGGQWFTTSQGEMDGRTTPTPSKKSTVATPITKHTNVDISDTNSALSSSKTLENEIRSDDPSLSTNDPPVGQSRGKRGKNAELMNSSRKKRRSETEIRSLIALREGAKDTTRSQDNMGVPVPECNTNTNGMTVSQEQLPSERIPNVVQLVVDKEAETPTRKRGRGRPPKLQGVILTPETPIPGSRMFLFNDEDEVVSVSERSASSATKPLEEEATTTKLPNVELQYSSMRGKRGKISLNSEDSRDKEGSVRRQSFGDKFPFKISSPALWKTIESMEAFTKIPQNPHFRPLEGIKESAREGLAIGSMVTFSGVLDKTCGLRFEDPRSTIEECLEIVGELESHGFEVGLIRERLTGLLLIKEEQEELQHRWRVAAKKVEEGRSEGEKVSLEMGEMEREMMELEERRRQLAAQREKHQREMNKAATDTIHQQLSQVALEFNGLRAAPFSA